MAAIICSMLEFCSYSLSLVSQKLNRVNYLINVDFLDHLCSKGMHRELYNLLYSENKELPCPIIPTDSNKDQGYKQIRAKLGMRKVRAWKWMPFSNPAR